ncbi:MAG: GNAT family N-acetyltransferase [Alphaproteobacteria bacterium]|nr:GNAT family N-acetyltransferase [Alphaproteobacteria bacterium]
MVPILETERLRLRGHRLDDFEQLAALWGDAIVTRFIGGKPSTREESWMRVLRNVGHWALLGYGYWVLEEKSSGRIAGEIGFSEFRRDIKPSIEGMPEAGWVLAPFGHGKGYATEGVKAMVAWGDAHFGSQTTACIIHPDNAASVGVAEKCGFREVARSTYKDSPSIVFHRRA